MYRGSLIVPDGCVVCAAKCIQRTEVRSKRQGSRWLEGGPQAPCHQGEPSLWGLGDDFWSVGQLWQREGSGAECLRGGGSFQSFWSGKEMCSSPFHSRVGATSVLWAGSLSGDGEVELLSWESEWRWSRWAFELGVWVEMEKLSFWAGSLSGDGEVELVWPVLELQQPVDRWLLRNDEEEERVSAPHSDAKPGRPLKIHTLTQAQSCGQQWRT